MDLTTTSQETKPETVQIDVKVDAKKMTYGDFKNLIKAQNGEVPMEVVFDIFDRCLVGNYDHLPVVDVLPAITSAVFGSMTEGIKAKN